MDGTPGGEPGGDKIAEISPDLDLPAFREILAHSGLGAMAYRLEHV